MDGQADDPGAGADTLNGCNRSRAAQALTTCALITGPFGQDGILFSRLLREKGYDVWDLAHPVDRPSANTGIFPEAQIIPGNIRDRHEVDQTLQGAHSE